MRAALYARVSTEWQAEENCKPDCKRTAYNGPAQDGRTGWREAPIQVQNPSKGDWTARAIMGIA